MAEGFLQGVDDLHAGKEGGNRGAAAATEEIDGEWEFRATGQDAIIVSTGLQDALEEFVAEFHCPAFVQRLYAFKYGPYQKTAQRVRRFVEGDAGVYRQGAENTLPARAPSVASSSALLQGWNLSASREDSTREIIRTPRARAAVCWRSSTVSRQK